MQKSPAMVEKYLTIQARQVCLHPPFPDKILLIYLNNSLNKLCIPPFESMKSLVGKKNEMAYIIIIFDKKFYF